MDIRYIKGLIRSFLAASCGLAAIIGFTCGGLILNHWLVITSLLFRSACRILIIS